MGKLAKWKTPEGLAKLEEMAAACITDNELMAQMGIANTTFYRWRAENEEIENAIVAGRNGAAAEAHNKAVENSLLERCLGGEHTVMKAMKVKEIAYDERGRRREEERIELVAETVYVPADTNAIKFWLTNRSPDKWKNRTEFSADPETRESVEDFLLRIADGGGREF